MTTQEQRQQWSALAQAATPGEWTVDGDEVWRNYGNGEPIRDECLAEAMNAADARFIAAARTAVPQLLADVDALTQERDALAAELARVRKEAADDRRAGATKLMQADAEIDGLRAQVARLEGFTESAQYSRDAELDLLDKLGDMA